MATQKSQTVHSGCTVLLKVKGKVVGRAQSLDGRRSYGTEGVYELGSIMPQDAEGNNKCIACTLCEKACPNGTITIKSEMVEVDGKKKRKLVDYQYDLGECMFCQLCVNVCPQRV